MAKKTISIEIDKLAVKTLLRIMDKYVEKHTFGSPLEQTAYNETYTKLKISLFELIFMDNES